MWLVIVQVEIQGLIFFLYTHFPAPFAEGTVFPSTYILTSFQKKSMDCNCMDSYHSFLLHSLRLYISFCFDDFAVYLEIRYGNSSSVVCREACTDLQSGSCLGQKFSDNWWTEYYFLWCLLLWMPQFPWVPVIPGLWMFMNSISIMESQHSS